MKQIWKIIASLIMVFTFSNQSVVSAVSQTKLTANSLPATSIEIANSNQLSQNWLERLNYYRLMAGLPPVIEVQAYSADLAKHVNYMLWNVPVEGLWHGETPGRPGYTIEGDQAATESNLYWYSSSSSPNCSPAMAVDAWMSSIYHRYGMLNPDLTTTGFALGCDNRNCGAGLNVLGGLVWGSNPRPDGVFYPGWNQKSVNTDIILTWQFLWGPTVVLLDASLEDVYGQPIPITTTSPSEGDYFNMVSVTPKNSLSPDMTYTSDITVQLGERQLNQTWSFSTAIFADVPPDYWSGDYIERLYTSGITGGCSNTPLSYCPENPVTRAQMAVFLEKSLHFPAIYTPPDSSATFNDTIGHWAEDWIKALRTDGITGGCGSETYCPDEAVTRAQMAIFLMRAEHGASYTPPPSTGMMFDDVPVNYWAAAWIEQLASEGITGGCGGGNYCPDTPVSRAQMAVFLVRTFNLP